ncbi:TIGR02611 family protein [Actinopolymorpha singaporensis]
MNAYRHTDHDEGVADGRQAVAPPRPDRRTVDDSDANASESDTPPRSDVRGSADHGDHEQDKHSDDHDDEDHKKKHRPWRRIQWHHRARRRIRRHPTLNATWRGAVFVVGVLLIVAGLVMFIAPGPGWLTVILGLAVLATEFAWAHRTLEWSKDKARAAGEKAMDPKARRRNLLIGAVVVVLVAATAAAWVVTQGLPGPAMSTWEWVRSLR